MKRFPVIVIDDFFNYPDKIRGFALSLEYQSCTGMNFSGKRTKPLSEVAPEFLNEVVKKFFSVYYDFSKEQATWDVEAYFQKTEGAFEKGWVHTDSYSGSGNKAACVIYLTPNAPLNSGTSIYKTKDNVLIPKMDGKAKHDYNTGQIPKAQGEAVRDAEANQFEETINVSNIYNRLISFDTSEYHCAQSYFGNNDNDARLMMVFFVRTFNASANPLEKLTTYSI